MKEISSDGQTNLPVLTVVSNIDDSHGFGMVSFQERITIRIRAYPMDLYPERILVKFFFFEERGRYQLLVSQSNLLLSMRTTFNIAYQFHNERPLRNDG